MSSAQDGFERRLSSVGADETGRVAFTSFRRLRARAPERQAERKKLVNALHDAETRLERLRHFILGGDTSTSVRAWLAEADRDEQAIKEE
jgi:hypothetical protein